MLESNIIRGSSAVEIARQVRDWATDIEPTYQVQDDDVLPLCLGPMRKVLTFSMSHFRNSSDVKSAAATFNVSIEKMKAVKRNKRMSEIRLIRSKIRISLNKEKVTRATLLNIIGQLQLSQIENDKKLRDCDGLTTGLKIRHEFYIKRYKEIRSWTQILEKCRELDRNERSASLVDELRSRSTNALVSSSIDTYDEVSTQIIMRVETTARNLASSAQKFTESNRRTHATVHSAIIADYTAAARLSHLATERYQDRIIFDVEDDAFFKNALALELATAEKSATKRCISEVSEHISSHHSLVFKRVTSTSEFTILAPTNALQATLLFFHRIFSSITSFLEKSPHSHRLNRH